MRPFPWVRASVAGLGGGAAWFLLVLLVFGPAQTILTNPTLQSAKMLAAFGAEPSPPRTYESPTIMVVGLLCIGLLWGWTYVWLASSWSGSWWARGGRFGIVSWVLMVPWFEFYLPWNVLLEPAALVGLEMVCWAVVLLGVGLTIAGVEAMLRGRGQR